MMLTVAKMHFTGDPGTFIKEQYYITVQENMNRKEFIWRASFGSTL